MLLYLFLVLLLFFLLAFCCCLVVFVDLILYPVYLVFLSFFIATFSWHFFSLHRPLHLFGILYCNRNPNLNFLFVCSLMTNINTVRASVSFDVFSLSHNPYLNHLILLSLSILIYFSCICSINYYYYYALTLQLQFFMCTTIHTISNVSSIW